MRIIPVRGRRMPWTLPVQHCPPVEGPRAPADRGGSWRLPTANSSRRMEGSRGSQSHFLQHGAQTLPDPSQIDRSATEAETPLEIDIPTSAECTVEPRGETDRRLVA